MRHEPSLASIQKSIYLVRGQENGCRSKMRKRERKQHNTEVESVTLPPGSSGEQEEEETGREGNATLGQTHRPPFKTNVRLFAAYSTQGPLL